MSLQLSRMTSNLWTVAFALTNCLLVRTGPTTPILALGGDFVNVLP
jgi:hypothetical protein